MLSEKATDIKVLLSGLSAVFVGLFGWLGVGVALLVLAMLVDYITGSVAARAAGEWSSAVARAGLRHKLGEILAVGAAAFADLGVNVALRSGAGVLFATAPNWPECFTMIVVFWYLFTEVGSIIENAGKLGAPIPAWLGKGIVVLKAKFNQAGENIHPYEDPYEDLNKAYDVPQGEDDPSNQGKHETDSEKQ